MRRALIVAAASVATATAVLPAVASTADGRVVHRSYKLATSAASGTGIVDCCAFGVDGDDYGIAYAHAAPGERQVSIALHDETGKPVAGIVEEASGKRYRSLGVVCASRTFRLPYPSGEVTIRPAYGQCGSGVSLPTEGTVDFRFSR